MTQIKELMTQIHKNNVEKGFWDDKETKNLGEMLMLVNSELVEALEADRINFYVDRKQFDFEYDFVDAYEDSGAFFFAFENNVKNSFEDEIADAVIRLFDISKGLGIDLEWHIKAKMAYNALRPHKHGKKY